jgi:hypothetical protein
MNILELKREGEFSVSKRTKQHFFGLSAEMLNSLEEQESFHGLLITELLS